MRFPPSLWILIALGALLRFAAIELRPEGALFSAPDEPDYLALSESVAAGNGFAFYGEPTAYRDVLFPALAGGIMVFSGNEHAVFYLQLLLDLATAVLLFLIARRWYSEATAVTIAGAWLVYPAAILFTSLFLTETLFVFLWVLTLWVYVRTERSNAIGPAIFVGAILGLLTLTRSTGVILALAILLHLAYRRHFRSALLVVVVAFVVILPWMMRNAAVMGSFSLNTNSGINLYQGSNPYATGAYRFDDPVTAPLDSFPAHFGGNAHGQTEEVWRNRRATELSIEYLSAHPIDALTLWPKKFAYFWSTDMALWAHYLPHPEMSLAAQLRSAPLHLLILIGLYYALMVAGGAAGLVLVKTLPMRGLLITPILLATLAAFATYGLARYHYPLMPALLLGAAPLVDAPGAWRASTVPRRLAVIVLVVLLSTVWLFESLRIAAG